MTLESRRKAIAERIRSGKWMNYSAAQNIADHIDRGDFDDLIGDVETCYNCETHVCCDADGNPIMSKVFDRVVVRAK